MFYLIEIAQGDSKIAGKGIYSYNSEREALANFHSKLGVAMKSDPYTSDVLVVIDQMGNTVIKECYVAPVVTPEVEPVEE